MTSIAARPNAPTDPGDPGPPIRRVGRDARRAALGLLMTGRPDPSDPAVEQFQAFAAEHQLDLGRFYAAYDGPTPIACALLVPGAGRTAMLFTQPLRRSGQVALSARVVRHGLALLDPAQTVLVQSLTDPAQKLERAALADAGLVHLAELSYMQAYVEPRGLAVDMTDPATGRPLRAVRWSEADRPVFERAILDSYAGTLDCPGLLGLRDVSDIIAGHRSAGVFDPGLWTVWLAGETPVAVLLVAAVPARQAHELVYLGVSEAARGRGLGGKLVRVALSAVAARGGGRLHLAVDARNTPAVRLYQRHGFRANAHKAAMIWTLDESP